MKNVLKVGAVGALALGSVGAHAAIAQPSSGASDAILFGEVLGAGSSVVASYAGDTGVSVSALTTGVTGSTTYLASDPNLQALFAADAAGDTLIWSLQGGQYTMGDNAPNFGVKGNAQFITTSGNGTPTGTSATNKLSTTTTNALVQWGKLNGDVSTINTNSGGANSVEGASPASAGVFDITQGSANVSDWYGFGPTAYNQEGTASEIFAVTGNGGPVSKVSYSNPATETAVLTAAGLTISGANTGGGGGTTPPPPVPLPAAVWLLGSGLLGLAGVSRRKAKA